MSWASFSSRGHIAAAALGCAALLLGAQTARAEILIDLPGPPSNASNVASTQYNAVAFSLSADFFNVSVSASLVEDDPGTSMGTAYLTTAIGPAATPADVVATTTFQFTEVLNAANTLGYVNLFSGLTLPADDYFLVVGDPVTGTAVGGISLRTGAAYTLHPNASVGSMSFSAGTNRNPAFVPGSTFVTSSLGNRFIRVEGEIPEPSAATLLLGAAALPLLRRRT